MKKNILITGASGMLGATLVKYFENEHQVFSTGNSKNIGFHANNYKSFNLENDTYDDLIDWCSPNVIIHCAALTNGNECQKNPLRAIEINGISLKKLISSTHDKVHIIYISTDAVFSNNTNNATENDCSNPESIYGLSKQTGEFFLKNFSSNYTIIRTTIVGKNLNGNREGFAEWIINSAKNNNEISLFNDVLFTPISIWNLAQQINYIINNLNIFNKEILHVSGSEACTKYEFGVALLETLGLQTSTIKKGSIKSLFDRAKRSSDQSLDCSKYQRLSKIKLPNLLQTVNDFKIQK